MSDPVTAVLATYESGVVSHCQELPPSPQRKIYASALLKFLELFWWLPVVLFAEEVHRECGSTTCQKSANVVD